jgi:hypothetical protein
MSFIGYTIVCDECGYRRSDLRVSQSELREIQLRGCPRCGAKNWDSFWVCNCDGRHHIDRHCSCDRCNSQEPSSGGGSGCFLTTVVCAVLGYDDNCMALDNLRKFRGDVLEKTNDGQGLLAEYRRISDRIAPNIVSDEEKINVCRYVYDEYIMPVNMLVDECKNESAIEKYKCMVNYFIDRYKIETV